MTHNATGRLLRGLERLGDSQSGVETVGTEPIQQTTELHRDFLAVKSQNRITSHHGVNSRLTPQVSGGFL